MVQKAKHHYVLVLPHIKQYYDMKLTTFGLDNNDSFKVTFSVFIKAFNTEIGFCMRLKQSQFLPMILMRQPTVTAQ